MVISQVMNFSDGMVATFIAVVGILSVVAQTALLSLLMKKLSNKHVIMVSEDWWRYGTIHTFPYHPATWDLYQNYQIEGVLMLRIPFSFIWSFRELA